ncbi:MAG TPA: IS1634 family transposase [Candidatus Tectomicrobia bacterium]
MNTIPNIITERVDDIPLLIEQMQRMGLPTLFDDHFPTHGNWTGLSLGWVSTIWLSSMLSRGDHRMVHVEPWVAKRLWTLRVTTSQAVRRVDFTDDRLESVLRRLSDDTWWAAFESALNQHTVRVYNLAAERVHVDSTSASVYATVSAGGLFQFGHSKDERPDLPQVKVMQAVLDPLGMPLATDVVSGERADDPLYMPCIERVQASMGRHGLLYVGDCKMASRDTRARIAAAGDFYLCPLPQVQLDEGEFDAALAALCKGEHTLSAVVRERPQGQPELIAEGYEYPVAMSQQGDGKVESWTERRLVVRSMRQAQAAEAALRARVAKAMAQIEALNQRGRGKKRFETVSALRQAAVAIVQRYGVEHLVWFRLTPHVTSRPVRAYRGQPARVDHDRHATIEARVDEAALEATIGRLGWRVYGTNQPLASLSLAQAVLAYRSEYQVERSFGRLKGRPLSLTPMYVQRDDHATGLIRLLSIALRVLTLLEFVGRRQLATEGARLAGLYAGNPKRETDRPTSERLLEAFQDITLTIIKRPQQTERHVTALSPLQQRILEVLDFSSALYTRLCTVSSEPP